MDAAVFAVLGLLLAFSISSAADRLMERRDIASAEVNAVRTAFLRAEVLEPAPRKAVQNLLREYVEARIRYTNELYEGTISDTDETDALRLQEKIWRDVLTYCKPADRNFLLPHFNELFSVASTRSVDGQTHTPMMLLILIVVLSLFASFISGRAASTLGERSLPHWIVFAATVTLIFGTLIDLDNASVGYIRIDAADKAWMRLQEQVSRNQL